MAVGANAWLPPWQQKPLDEWRLAAMNHYQLDNEGTPRLYVIMTKGDRFIKEEGPDDPYLWNRLWKKAREG